MSELPPRAMKVIAEIGSIVSSPAPERERADAMLAAVRRCIPYDGAALAVLDIDQRVFVSLASTGYSRLILDYRGTVAYQDDLGSVGLLRDRPPLTLRDLPMPPAELPIWADYLEPAGFREGLAATLFTRDGRHLGVLSAHTERPEDPGDEVRAFVSLISPLIVTAFDPIRSLAALTRMVGDAVAGILLTRAGRCLPLPGLLNDERLAEGSELVLTAAALVDDQAHVTFVCPDGGGYSRVTAFRCRSEAGPHLAAVVLLSPIGDLAGLTRRELGILGLLVEGWSNRRIAAALVIAGRTVDAHVAHILAKLRAGSRTQAAVRALRHGLYLPRPLNGVPR
nr:helix-turn-helix transcriptional regulator [Micromonospora sp. DSM 115978]